MLAGDEDARIMLAFQNGDNSAFDALFRRWAARVLAYVSRVTCDADTAEALVLDVFLRVFRARERYVADLRFSTWLYRIASNVALDELRRAQRRRPETARGAPGGGGPASPSAGRGETLRDPTAASRVPAALTTIPDRQRAALHLVAVEGLSYAELAESLETSEVSAKALVHRGRSALADRLEAAD
ncbi:MAG: RNA polymerase sigma factor [Deltaproteobacteria bacterium]|nr:MAG: RNA polymerase sigma factor [Deltaproteobacteria bacterium]